MFRILLRFWPVLLPLLLCLLWVLYKRRKARKAGLEVPRFSDGPWYWATVASIALAVVCFLVLGFANAPLEGTYEPAHIEDGKIIQGTVSP